MPSPTVTQETFVFFYRAATQGCPYGVLYNNRFIYSVGAPYVVARNVADIAT